MTKKRYTFKEVLAMFPHDADAGGGGLSANKLRYMTVGRKQEKWFTQPLLTAKADFKLAIENNRSKYYYYSSAIEKIRKHLGE